jgi:SOS-response transcriptional repressor LexA
MNSKEVINGKLLKNMRVVSLSRDQCLEKKMTEKQKMIFEVIDEWWKRYGYGPSIDNIMYMTGDKGRANVHRQIKILCDIGACKRLPGRARSVRPAYINFKQI